MSDRKSRIAGVPPTPTFTANERELSAMGEIVANISSMRGEFWKSLMDPRRDVYAECGYPRAGNVTADMLQQLYDNEAIPARVVEVLPKECWQVTPSVFDEEGDEVTPFEEAWDNLGKQMRGEQSFYKDEEGSPVWDYLQRLDIMAGIGQYGVLLIGFDDGEDLSRPVKGLDESGSQPVDSDRPKEEYPEDGKGTDTAGGLKQKDGYTPAYPTYSGRKTTTNALTCNGRPVEYRREKYRLTSNLVFTTNAFATPPDPDTSAGSDESDVGPDGKPQVPEGKKPVAGEGKKILYLRVFPESLAQVTQWETNLDSPRYGQPVMYQMTFGDPRTVTGMTAPPNTTRNVHWTRCIHVPSDGAPTSNEVLGRSRMSQVLHQLMNLTKMYGANGEGYWKEAFGTLVLKTQAAAGVNPRVNKPALRNMVEALQMGLQRELMLQGMDAEMLAPSLTDITPHKDAQLEAICIKLGVPIRVFKGSERGELASSQDDASWNDRLRSRQRTFVTPRIIVPFVDRLILCGVLPKPVGGTKKPAKPSMIAPGLPADAVPAEEGAKTPGDVPDAEKLGTDGMAPDMAEPKKKPVVVANIAFPPKKPAPFVPGKPTPPSLPPGRDSVLDDEEQSIEDMVSEGVAEEDAAIPPEEREEPGYSVEWPDLDSQTKAEQATIAQGMTTALAAYVSGGLDALISPKDYLTRVCYFEESEVDAMLANTELVKQKKAEEEALAAEEAMVQQAQMIDEGLAPDPTDPEAMVAMSTLPGGFPPKPGGPPAPGQPPAGPKKPGFPPTANAQPYTEYVLTNGKWTQTANAKDDDGRNHAPPGSSIGGQFVSGGGGGQKPGSTATAHTSDAAEGGGSHGKVEVGGNGTDPEKVRAVIKSTFGKDVDPNLIAKAANLDVGGSAKIGLSETGKMLVVSTSNPGGGALRQFYKSGNDVIVHNDTFKNNLQGGGKGRRGADILADQVKALKEIGVTKIETHAARLDSNDPNTKLVGYAVWPKLGYDGTLKDEQFDKLPQPIKTAMGWKKGKLFGAVGGVKGSRSLQDLYDLPGGPEAWEKHGSGIDAHFDLKDGSRSMKKLEAYLKNRDAKKPTGNAFCPTREGGGVDPSCGTGGPSAGKHLDTSATRIKVDKFLPVDTKANDEILERDDGSYMGRMRSVKIADLVATQETVDPKKVNYFIDQDKEFGENVLIWHMNGKDYVGDGHHRIIAAKLRGDDEIRAERIFMRDKDG